MILISFFFFIFANSIVRHNPITEPNFPVIQNQGFTSELNRTYNRFPRRAKTRVNETIWDLSLDSAGLSIYFKTDSSHITITYNCIKSFHMVHMPSTGVSGISLLTRTNGGRWGSIKSKFNFTPSQKKVEYNFFDDRKSDSEYRLYLPPYNTIENLEIKTDDKSTFTWIEKDNSMPIVVYGTSIVQGCCSTNPAVTWPNLVQRHFNVPLLNFGFSGNGKLDEEVLDFIIENEASLYVLDCLPNIYFYDLNEIKKRVLNSVLQIRKKWKNTPILLVDFAGLNYIENDVVALNQINEANLAQKQVFDKLCSDKFVNLFYLSREEIGFNFDCWTDYIHPNNLGMKYYADAYIKKIGRILNYSMDNDNSNLNIGIKADEKVRKYNGELMYLVYILILVLLCFYVMSIYKRNSRFL